MQLMDITSKCEEHMLMIRNGLRDREIWALKMLDASSHIGSDFIWGNNILIGSPRSCNLISHPANVKFATDHVPVGIINLTQVTAPIRVGYRSIHARHWSEMQVDLSTLEKNVLNFGFCLPLSCSNVDSFRLLEAILQNKTFVDRSLIGMNTEVIHTKILQLRENFLKNPFVTAFFIILYLVLFFIVLDLAYTITGKLGSWILPPDLTLEKKKPKLFERILSCFSIIENTKIIISQEIGKESIEVLHGIRVIGMLLFIIGHIMLFAMSSVTNMQHILVYADNFWLQATLHHSFNFGYIFRSERNGIVLHILSEFERKANKKQDFVLSAYGGEPIFEINTPIRNKFIADRCNNKFS
ncbi:uncharacterized protein LOC119652639 isoform X1 [Hermetia illucens]|uniref:uncharacterized protein LOC119652639 isoform X1 n=2 Tax=Hermetia illucens TaxID=343691 RepID=UPI0018CC682F|nr:uncharacterized protein LOC119652639 isoform X1 [Hermetia illucens]